MAVWILSGTTQVSWYQKKHSPTHTYRGRQSSLISFLHLLWSTACSLFNLHAWQSLSTISFQVFFWSTSWPGTLHFILHTFLHPIIVFFSQHMPIPYHHNLFCCSSMIMSSNPSLSLNPLLGTLSCSLTPQIHLTIVDAPSIISLKNRLDKYWRKFDMKLCFSAHQSTNTCTCIGLNLECINLAMPLYQKTCGRSFRCCQKLWS